MSSMSFPQPSEEDFSWDFSAEIENDDAFDFLLLPADTPMADQYALEDLFEQGFSWEEGVRLLILREHLYDLPEITERLTCDPHLDFMRWLYRRGVLTS